MPGNVLTKDQYLDERDERLGACALDRTGLYDANFKLPNYDSGAFAVKRLVKITSLDKVGEEFILTCEAPTSGATLTRRISMNGILHKIGGTDDDEDGYLVTPPMDDWDIGLLNLTEELTIPIERQLKPQERLKHLEAPLPNTYEV